MRSQKVTKDADSANAGKIQLFGIAGLEMGPELGYISIPEWLEVGAKIGFN